MSMTMSEKIICMASRVNEVKAGDVVVVNVDIAMMDDILGPRVEIAEKLECYNIDIWDKNKVVVISDHYTPSANSHQANIVKFTRNWTKINKIENYFEGEGPCHQVMVDNGLVKPSYVIVGTDSHTCTYGALGAFGIGIGSTEMFGVLATGEIWLRVPDTIKVYWEGELNRGVMAKDISLKTIKELGHKGATYKTIEYSGKAINKLIIDERLCLANMGVEAGAKATLLPQDKIVEDFLKRKGITHYELVESDKDCKYSQILNFDAEKLVPQVACPHEVDNVVDVTELEHVKIDQAYIGSCTGGRYYDLKLAAEILKGRKISEHVRLLISPASKEIYKQCLKDGILEILSDAGAIILASSCGACLGIHSGALGQGEVCISSTNRNFIGRMGDLESFVYLGSPVTVAAAAIEGYICDPRKYM